MADSIVFTAFNRGELFSYRRLLSLHASLIAFWLLGEVPTLAFLTTR